MVLLLCAFLLGNRIAHSDYHLGADLSFVPRLEQEGVVFTVEGDPADALTIFEAAGYDVVRLRLWHTPVEPWHGLDSTIAFAQRAVNSGLDVLLDFHYSDTWADPGHQSKPAAWEGLPFSVLVDSVYSYTNNVIREFRDAGAPPKYVQIGNEITPGMLWPEGRVGGAWDTPQQWDQLCTLLDAGADACRDSLPLEQRPEIMIHIAAGGDNGTSIWFFDWLAMWGLDYDIIAQSYYPWWHGTLDDLEFNLNDLAARYGKKLWVVETAYPWTLSWNDNTHNFVGLPEQLLPGYPATPQGQRDLLAELCRIVHDVPDGLGAGICYWEPAWVVADSFGSVWENLALFDFGNEATPALAMFQQDRPPEVTILPAGESVQLMWHPVTLCGSPAVEYRVYYSPTLSDTFSNFLDSAADTVMIHENATGQYAKLFYRVIAE